MGMASSLRFVHFVISSTLLISSLLIPVYSDDPNFRVVSVESLTAPPLVCSRSKARPQHSLEIVHRHGPCYPYVGNKSVDHHQVLKWDSLRVAYLQARLSNAAVIRQKVSLLQATLPVPGVYVVTVGLGTPKTDQPVNFDTGSDLCWVQCQPCLGKCYRQTASIFDPLTSSTYRNISCTSSICINKQMCARNDCLYHVEYADLSYSDGHIAHETLTLTPNDVIPKFIFGCGQNNVGPGLFRQYEAGVFGLGRGRFSMVSQTANNLGNVFSYCLPRSSSSTGYLTLGPSSASSAQYTPMLDNNSGPSYYYIDLTGISVGGRRLPVSPMVFRGPGTVIDSGSTVTSLPPSAYDELRSAFRNAMSQYPLAPRTLSLDTCYDFSSPSQVSHPTITLHYNGTSVTLRSEGIFYAVGSNKICLAFKKSSNPKGLGIIGAVQQRGHEVIYDIGAKRIGFVPNAC